MFSSIAILAASLCVSVVSASPLQGRADSPAILYPNTASTWVAGVQHNVTWDITTPQSGTTNIYFGYSTGGQNVIYTTPIASNVDLSKGRYEITVPNIPPMASYVLSLDFSSFSSPFAVAAGSSPASAIPTSGFTTVAAGGGASGTSTATGSVSGSGASSTATVTSIVSSGTVSGSAASASATAPLSAVSSSAASVISSASSVLGSASSAASSASEASASASKAAGSSSAAGASSSSSAAQMNGAASLGLIGSGVAALLMILA